MVLDGNGSLTEVLDPNLLHGIGPWGRGAGVVAASRWTPSPERPGVAMKIVWTDERDGRTWEVRNNAPQALAMESFELRAHPLDFENRILFQHPPLPPYVVQASAPNPDAKLVGDMGDEELQGLLDRALRKGPGGE